MVSLYISSSEFALPSDQIAEKEKTSVSGIVHQLFNSSISELSTLPAEEEVRLAPPAFVKRVSLPSSEEGPLTPCKPPENKKMECQLALDKAEIPLDCRNPAEPKERIRVNSLEVEAYLNDPVAKQSREYEENKTILEKMEVISLEQLEHGAKRCTEEFNRMLPRGTKYAVGGIYKTKKSQGWIAEKVLPFMDTYPVAHFGYFSDTKGLPKECFTFAIFDDASYSGSQVEASIRLLKEQILKEGSKEGKYRLFLAIPFISSYALQRIVPAVESCKGILEVCLITTNKQIKTVGEALVNGSEDGRCITFFEHKLADSISLHPCISSGFWTESTSGFSKFEMIVEFEPCYNSTD